jgi:hypothetical protein
MYKASKKLESAAVVSLILFFRPGVEYATPSMDSIPT